MKEFVERGSEQERMLPGRTIWPDGEALSRAAPGWRTPGWRGEAEVWRERVVEDEEHAAAREWLRHVASGRIG